MTLSAGAKLGPYEILSPLGGRDAARSVGLLAFPS